MRAERRNGVWAVLAVTGGLVGACNAIFGIEEPVHQKDEGTGGDAGDVGTGGGTGGSDQGGTTGDGGTGGNATGGKSGTGGAATGGKGGTAGTSAGDSGTGGESGGATGGTTSTGGTTNTGGTSGGTGCPANPDDCEPENPPSCAGLSNTACAGTSCCASPPVAGCTGCAFPEVMHDTTVSPFRLDAFEVTVARFRNFVNAYTGPLDGGQGTQPNVPGTGWSAAWDGLIASSKGALTDNVLRCNADSTFTVDPGPNDQKPMNCLSWYEAFTFCVWDGGFLPTELQRTFAAANGEERRYYPWDASTLDHQHALWGFCSTGGSTSCAVSDITNVGSFPLGVGAFGQHDLTGSMWEWVFDYDGGAWPPADPCDDCANLTPPAGNVRLIRGGAWSQGEAEQPVTYRNANDPPTSYWKNVGVRCARAQ